MDEGAAPPRKRRRPPLSCVLCRRRKVKCDRNNPSCGQCTQSKSSATCSYSPDDAPAPVNRCRMEAANSSTTSSTTRRFGSLGLNHSPILSFSGSSASHILSSSSLGAVSEISLPSRHSEPIAQEPKDQAHQLQQSDAVSRFPNNAANILVSPETAPHMRGSLSKTRFFGQNHWTIILEQLNFLGYFKRKLESASKGTSKEEDESSEVFRLLEMCKVVAKVVKAARPTQLLPLPDFKNSVPNQEISDQLVHLYLRTFESTFRILHIPTFHKEYSQYWKEPQAANPGFVVKLLLVMAIGTCFYHGETIDWNTLRSLAHQWIYGASSWLSAPSEKSRMNLTGLQVHCLLLLARQTNDIDGDLIWISAGPALRLAFNMGLHRDPKYFPHMTIFSAEMRRRLWATVLEMAVQASLDAAMPPLISPHDFDCEPPSNFDDAEIEEGTQIPPISKPMTSFTQTALQITLLESLPLRLEIARLINDFRIDMSYDDVLKLGADLTKACHQNAFAMQSYLSAPIVQHHSRPTEFHRSLLDLLTRRFLLALHRPFAIRARKDPRFYFSRKVCLESALILTSYVGDLAEASNIQDDFTCLAVTGGGTIEGAILHDASMSICLELVAQLEEDMPSSSSITPTRQPSIINQVSRSAREPLIQAMKHLIELARCRISMGKTNVKGHVFLSAIMASIKATELGEAPEIAGFKAAKESAQICYTLLRSRVASTPSESVEENSPDAQSIPGIEVERDFGFDALMQEPSIQLNVPDSWFFSSWDENDLWL